MPRLNTKLKITSLKSLQFDHQKYDQKKTGLLLGKGVKIIRVKQTKDFSKSRSNIVYDRLTHAINELKTNNTLNTIEIGDENV